MKFMAGWKWGLVEWMPEDGWIKGWRWGNGQGGQRRSNGDRIRLFSARPVWRGIGTRKEQRKLKKGNGIEKWIIYYELFIVKTGKMS